MAPTSLVPLGLAGFILPLITNVIVTTLIVMRIWYLSPRKVRDMHSARFPTGTGRAVIDIIVESGMLYLVVQLAWVILFAIGHPAQDIAGVVAVQIYVRSISVHHRESFCPLNHAGHRTDINPCPRCSRLVVEYAVRPDSQWGCRTFCVAADVVNESAYW
jgi:hypothetical protein